MTKGIAIDAKAGVTTSTLVATIGLVAITIKNVESTIDVVEVNGCY